MTREDAADVYVYGGAEADWLDDALEALHRGESVILAGEDIAELEDSIQANMDALAACKFNEAPGLHERRTGHPATIDRLSVEPGEGR